MFNKVNQNQDIKLFLNKSFKNIVFVFKRKLNNISKISIFIFITHACKQINVYL